MGQDDLKARASENYNTNAQSGTRTIKAFLNSLLFRVGHLAATGQVLQTDGLSFSRAFRDDLGEKSMLNIIERALEIGDTRMSTRHLANWQSELEQSSDIQVQLRVRAARERLMNLLKEETIRGRFACLNRSAPEIMSYERECRRMRRQSIYGNVGPAVSELDKPSASFVASPTALS